MPQPDELVTWLIAQVPSKYLPPPVLEMADAVQCGSLDGLDEIIHAYIAGEDYLDRKFRTMTREEILNWMPANEPT